MGFAWKKTHDVFLAEDLAQEILAALTSALKRHESIADMDGFVFTVSCYTWSKFLRGNKRHWNNLDIDALENLQSGQQVEKEAENAWIIERLQTEIAYLTGLHRKILLLFYYENKTGAEIAKLLDIPAGTVRWHVSEIKKKLKEGIEMEENLSFKPKRLWCGHDGWTNDFNMHGIGQNPLVDNICISCYGKDLSIEEISRTLKVAAFYIEPLVKDLLYMDYLRLVDRNKYTTNFYIESTQFQLSKARYKFHNIEPIARRICEVFRQHLDEIKAIGFIGSDLNSGFLLWALIPVALQNIYYKSLEFVLGKNKIAIDTPLRKDGTRHWVRAGFKDDEEALGFTPEEKDFSEKSQGNGIKTRSCDSGERSLQYDGYATIQTGIHWREFGSDDDLRTIRHIAELIRKNEIPNDYDKIKIATFVQQGYAKTDDGHLRLLIPFFNAEEWAAFNKVLDKIQKEIGETMFEGFIEGFADAMENEIPSFISRDEKIYLKYSAYPQYAVLYWLADNDLLRYPTDEEAKRLCTVVWCEKQDMV